MGRKALRLLLAHLISQYILLTGVCRRQRVGGSAAGRLGGWPPPGSQVTDTARRASTVTSSKGDTLLKTGIESVKVTC